MLFGAPGVGKGTYGKLITKEYGFPTFSMGDYFRRVINEDDTVRAPGQKEFVVNLRALLRGGNFVDDETAIEVIKRAREIQHKDDETLILDGMPRTVA